MKIREYLKSLSFANPQITFAPDFEHYRIYDDFVCDRMLEEGVDHPGEYSGQASIKLVCAQHPFSLEEGMYDPRGCEKKQHAYTQEWVEYLKIINECVYDCNNDISQFVGRYYKSRICNLGTGDFYAP